MEEIKWTNTGADPIEGSDPVSVKSKEQKEETASVPEEGKRKKPKAAQDKKPAKELELASFVLRDRDEDRMDTPDQPARRKKKKRSENGTVREEAREGARRSAADEGPSVLKRQKRRAEEEEAPKRKRRKRPVQETEPDERSERTSPSLAGIIARIVVLLILAGVIAMIILMNMFQLKEIKVSGNKNYSQEQIIEMVGIPSDAGNTLLTYMRFKDEKATDKPLIKYLRIYMADRNTLGIEVAETAIVGEIKSLGTHYCFDNGGYVQEILTERKKGVPKVTGINMHEPQIGEKIVTEDDVYFANIIELCQMVTERKINADEIEVAGDNSIMIYIDDNIRIAFGSPLLMEAKISEIVNILPELLRMEETEGLSGTLHLENYSTFQKSIVFTPEKLPERDSDGESSGKKKKSRKNDDEDDEDTDEDASEDRDEAYDDSDWSDEDVSYEDADEDGYSDWSDE